MYGCVICHYVIYSLSTELSLVDSHSRKALRLQQLRLLSEVYNISLLIAACTCLHACTYVYMHVHVQTFSHQSLSFCSCTCI